MSKAVSCLALGAMLLGIWPTEACRTICAQEAKACASGCHTASSQAGAGAACPDTPCSQLQTNIPSSLQPERTERTELPLVEMLPSRNARDCRLNGVTMPRPGLHDLGPPVPPSLFTVLRA